MGHQYITVVVLKYGATWFYNAVIYQKDLDRMANSVDLDQEQPGIGQYNPIHL